MMSPWLLRLENIIGIREGRMPSWVVNHARQIGSERDEEGEEGEEGEGAEEQARKTGTHVKDEGVVGWARGKEM